MGVASLPRRRAIIAAHCVLPLIVLTGRETLRGHARHGVRCSGSWSGGGARPAFVLAPVPIWGHRPAGPTAMLARPFGGVSYWAAHLCVQPAPLKLADASPSPPIWQYNAAAPGRIVLLAGCSCCRTLLQNTLMLCRQVARSFIRRGAVAAGTRGGVRARASLRPAHATTGRPR